MPGQPKLFPDSETVDEGEALQTRAASVKGARTGLGDAPLHPGQRAAGAGTRTAPVWLQRVSLIVLVLFCVYLGVLVMVLPWWTRIWDHNMFLQARPALAALLHTGAVRGMISGLGVLDIWIGISEAVHYRDYRG